MICGQLLAETESLESHTGVVVNELGLNELGGGPGEQRVSHFVRRRPNFPFQVYSIDKRFIDKLRMV